MIQLESTEHDHISLSLTSKCKVSPERRVLDLESEVMRGPGSIPLGVSFFTGFFSRSKASAANIGIIVIIVHFRKHSSVMVTGADS